MHLRPRLTVVSLALAAAALSVSDLAAAPHADRGTARPGARQLTARDEELKALLARMTLDEKIGQMLQPEQDKVKDNDLERYHLGSVLSGGNSDPRTNSLQDWTDLYDSLQSRALKTRLAIPILYGIDAVHGHSNVQGSVIFPHNIGLGATRDAKLVQEIARITALEMKATGIQWTFAPCVAVVRDERWGRTYESFGEEPSLVAELGAAAVRGLQGASLAHPHSVLACAKHYVGDGGTTWGTGRPDKSLPEGRSPLDQGDTRLSEAELRRLHMEGYLSALAEGVGSIMPSYSMWNGERASGSKRLLTEILKDELGFEGFLISDYNAIDDLPGDFRADVKQSVNAGMDMFMVPDKFRELFQTLKSLVEAGEVPLARIDDAVTRILRAKYALGLFDPGRQQLADRSLHQSFGSKAHREVARRAVQQSLVLLKNDKKTLPLAKTAKRIHVAGKNADDLGNQTGGWTITWQGQSGTTTVGTTILAGLRSAANGEVTFSIDGTGAEGADVGVVVVGETPYAEGSGDRADLSLDAADKAVIDNVKKAGIPLVLVLVSGRPMILGEALTQADGIVAAWLPGTEGQGVADVLFGDAKPTGKLSFTWPRTMEQIPVNVGDRVYDPLFPYGFGLTW
jgi:beta-glucosidase